MIPKPPNPPNIELRPTPHTHSELFTFANLFTASQTWTKEVIRYYAREKRRLKELEQTEPGCWINLSPPFAPDELESFAKRFDIWEDFLTDSLDIDERARYERDGDVRFVIINTPVLNQADREAEAIYTTVPIGIIMTMEHVITISAMESPVLKVFIENRLRNFDPINEKHFVLQIMEQNVMRYISCLKKLNLKRNHIEKELMNSSRNSDLQQLLSIEKSLVYFINSLNANELLKMKMKRSDFLQIGGDEELNDLFEEIIIDNSQALSMANVYANILNGTMDAYSSIISNNLNQVIHRLTVITVVLMVPTLVSSFFGMNIPNGIPENPYLFYVVVLATVFITAFFVWVLYRKKVI
jgi:magnesium transporter